MADPEIENLREQQKKNCLFCHIGKGETPSKKIFEDDKTFAFLDINPASPGHILLIPKDHYALLQEMPEDVVKHLFQVAKQLTQTMLKGLKSTGTNIFVANGMAAGQKAPHVIVHLIPRKDNDGLGLFPLQKRRMPDSEMKKLQEQMARILKEKKIVKEEQQSHGNNHDTKKSHGNDTHGVHPTPEHGHPEAHASAPEKKSDQKHHAELAPKKEEQKPFPEPNNKGGEVDLDDISSLFS
ncbi:HIT domain-containing protein [Candidatus Woesearchaeota archaeon]|nr:HIT domain-containing protein [Candidatus Woesearchaeota archaeon]